MLLLVCHTSLYAPLAERCVASFARYGLVVERVPYSGFATGPAAWKRNTLLKVAAFADRVARDSFVRPAWLFDADVEAVEDPTEPLRTALEGYDIAAPFAPPNTRDAMSRDSMVSAGCVGFAGSPLGAWSLGLWHGQTDRALSLPAEALASRTLYEQVALIDTIEQAERAGARVNRLPPSMGMRPDLVTAAGLKPILRHLPASHHEQMKKKVGSPDCPKGA